MNRIKFSATLIGLCMVLLGAAGAQAGTGSAVSNTITVDTRDFALTACRLLFTVYDAKTGAPLQGATVNLDGQILTADSGGAVLFAGLALGGHTISLAKTGYSAYQASINLTTAGLTKMGRSLLPTTAGTGSKPVVTDVTSFYSSRDKSAYFLNGVDFSMNFFAQVDWNGKTPGKIRFITPQGNFEETSGNRIFNVGRDFGTGGRLQAVAISSDGISSVPFDANIEVMPLPPAMVINAGLKYSNNDFSYESILSLGDMRSIISKSSKAVPADIPFFGGKEFSFAAAAEFETVIGSDGVATYSLVGKKSEENAFKLGGAGFDLGTGLGGDIVSNINRTINPGISMPGM